MQHPKFLIMTNGFIYDRPSDPLEQHWRREQWPSNPKFDDSPAAQRDHGSPDRIVQSAPGSYCGSSALTCIQHPMAGIAAINRDGK